MDEAILVSDDSPVLVDKFLNNAIELDVDAICDGKDVYIGSVMQHIEEAGIHSGDSACSLPPVSISTKLQEEVKECITAGCDIHISKPVRKKVLLSELDSLVKIARDNGAFGAKLTGGGLGGNIVALTPGKDLQENVAVAIEKEGFEVLRTTIG
jgi:mevalonate kinase